MPLSELIAPELPFLRRFARAISGSQDAGDAHVVAMLEALVVDNSKFPSDLPTKTAVFRTFLKVLSDEVAKVDQPATANNISPEHEAAERHLGLISLEPRQAFLLVTVEGFSTREAAVVLDTTPERVSELIDHAGKEIADQVATSVLIIEDEPLIALDLADVVTSIGHTVCAMAATHKEAVAAFKEHKPGLVLADVQLADGSSGLDAVREILASFEVPVIFITAFPERLLTGRPPEPAFLINKPFQPDTVKAVISQALFFEYKARKSAA
jgi:CheY-like chemotaxis protein/DNA-directed RNA polymerase specialized sigma24 family protein